MIAMDLKAEPAKLTTLRGRTPETPAAVREGAFARLAPCRDGAIFTGKFSGQSPGSATRTATPQPTEHLTVAVDDPRTLE
jgi:hypothetical protein